MIRKYATLPEQIEGFTVIREVEPKVYSNRSVHRRFLVRCKCGKEYTKDLYDLLKSKGCRACLRKNKFQVGQVIGDLTVVETDARHRNRADYVRLLCACGKEAWAQPGELAAGGRVSCGCRKKLTGASNRKWKGHGEISGKTWSHIRGHARTRGIDFGITIEDAWAAYVRQDGRCALSGEPLVLRGDITASLDRVDSKRGYTLDNIQWVHKVLNHMKMSIDQDDFVAWCRRVAAHHLQ